MQALSRKRKNDRDFYFARLSLTLVMCAAVGVVAWAQAPAQEPAPATQAAAAGRCRVEGQVKSGTVALPGVAVLVHVGDALKGATSTDANGKFSILFAPNATYHLTAELTAFAPAEHDVVLAAPPCDTKLDFLMTLRPRTEALPTAPTAAATIAAVQSPTAPVQGAAGQTAGQTTAASAPVTSPQAAATSPTGRAAQAGRGGAAGQRFETLTVQADANGASSLEVTPPDASADLSRMLPPGFSVQSAQAEAVAINGSSDALSLDRGALGDRLNSIGRGEFDPSTGQFAQGFGPGGGGDNPFGQGGRGGLGGDGQGGGGGGRGGPGGPGGGRGGPGGFTLGGRGGRGQSPYQGSVNYTFGGSALDATTLQPRNGVIVAAPQDPFSRNNVGGTIGGPLKIPGLYADTNRRTNFQVNYTGNHSTTLQDQYATVPSDAWRNGDFSSSSLQLIDPKTGLPFPGNQIPASQIDPAAQALLNYIPHANVPGATTQNYHNSGTTLSTSNSVSFRLTQNLSPNVGRAGAAGGRGGAGGGRGGAGGGRGGGGRGGRGLNILLSAQVQYRENAGQSFNIFPGLGGTSKSTSLTAPISLNISQGRTTHMISVNLARTKTTSSNLFSNVLDASGAAGINYPSTPDPLNWGVPNLTFSNFSLRSSGANVRTDTRLTTSYTLARPIKKQQLRFGVDFRHDLSSAETNSNARGQFTFTGLYTGNGAEASRETGADVADFLLGLPQQAALQVGGLTRLRENGFDMYVDDNWQRNSRLTLSLGLRYEVAFPYVEVNGQMANLDVTPNFTQATVVTPATGTFPAGLVNTDFNNVGPRLGLAYRLAKNTIVRGGYSITYNSGSYASIARQLVGQPPFAVTETNPGSLLAPITLENGLLAGTALTTNNFGVDRNYALGVIQTWNGTLSRDLSRNWTVIAGYTGTKGSDLDLLRAPNRNADGSLRIPDVQAFIWESSGGHSILNLGNFQLRRRLAHGFAGGLNYTLSKSMDNASSLGSGGAVVAQNDQDLAAEYALSNFDQRHQFTGDLTWELPFGVGRRWLNNGGKLAAIAGEWSMNFTVSAHSGSPFTARVVGAVNSVANGTSGSLRANYTGTTVQLTDPSLLAFFNTAAFQLPAAGFGTSARNMIIGPGGHVVNASFSRDMRIGGNRAVSIQVNANNLFNTIQWASIDTNFNSATFGQVTRFAGMRTLTLNLRFRF